MVFLILRKLLEGYNKSMRGKKMEIDEIGSSNNFMVFFDFKLSFGNKVNFH